MLYRAQFDPKLPRNDYCSLLPTVNAAEWEFSPSCSEQMDISDTLQYTIHGFGSGRRDRGLSAPLRTLLAAGDLWFVILLL